MSQNSYKSKLFKNKNYKQPKVISRAVKVYNRNKWDIDIESVDIFLAAKDPNT